MQNLLEQFEKVSNLIFKIESAGGSTDYNLITDEIIKLCEVINLTETDECTWLMGEYSECCLGDFLEGAYWHYTHHHEGQASKGYLALSALGDIFSPGMSCEPEPEDPAHITYDQLNEIVELNAITYGENIDVKRSINNIMHLLITYGNEGETNEEIITNVLTNLMLYCDWQKLDFDALLSSATCHFGHEKA